MPEHDRLSRSFSPLDDVFQELYWQGRQHMRNQEFRQALQVWDAILGLHPQRTHLWWQRVITLQNLMLDADAPDLKSLLELEGQSYRHIVHHQPLDHEAWHSLGGVYRDLAAHVLKAPEILHHQHAATECFREAMRLGHPEASRHLACVLLDSTFLHTGEIALQAAREALRLFSAACHVHPTDPGLRFDRACAVWRVGVHVGSDVRMFALASEGFLEVQQRGLDFAALRRRWAGCLWDWAAVCSGPDRLALLEKAALHFECAFCMEGERSDQQQLEGVLLDLVSSTHNMEHVLWLSRIQGSVASEEEPQH